MEETTKKAASAAARGMTLLEIMVVVLIISLIAGVVGVAVMGQLETAKGQTAGTQIKEFEKSLEFYKLKYRKYPTSAEGLEALTQSKDNEAPILKKVPKDPWGQDYVYIYPGTHNQGSFDIQSIGADGTADTQDDITNWSAGGEG
jgi:general secretion pathway protein G